MPRIAVILIAAFALVAIAQSGCNTDGGNGGGLDPTPEKLDGSSSQEFEADDIEAAENAPQSVQDYCGGAVSEAQETGCLSHVDPSEIP